ncbi:hypothetical protein BY996DRAFT_6414189 [Phakopsora pachyrhizi]|nr:hypothetical protein BY996DRAFT_6414189 [Phakopsora pachyrhizi]
MPKSKAYANPLPSLADEQRYGTKCHELRSKIREIERENQNIQLKISKSKRNIQRLRIERSVLYEVLATITATAAKASGLNLTNLAKTSEDPQLNLSQLNQPASQPAAANNQNGYQTLIGPRTSIASKHQLIQSKTVSDNHSQLLNPTYNQSAAEQLPSNGINSLLNINGNLHHPQNTEITLQTNSNKILTQNNTLRSVTSHTQLAPILPPDQSSNVHSYSSASTSPINQFQSSHQIQTTRSISHPNYQASIQTAQQPQQQLHHHPIEHSCSNPGSISSRHHNQPHSTARTNQSIINGSSVADQVSNRQGNNNGEEGTEEEEEEEEEEEVEEEEEEEESGFVEGEEEEEEEEDKEGAVDGQEVLGEGVNQSLDNAMELDVEGGEEE